MPVQNIQPDELKKIIQSGQAEIIDVRQPEEYAAAHIRNSKLLPMDEILQRLAEIDWSKEVVFVCRSGSRSGMMANLIAAQQGKNIKNLTGGVAGIYHGENRVMLDYQPGSVEDYL